MSALLSRASASLHDLAPSGALAVLSPAAAQQSRRSP
jgi:hypothetical protein